MLDVELTTGDMLTAWLKDGFTDTLNPGLVNVSVLRRLFAVRSVIIIFLSPVIDVSFSLIAVNCSGVNVDLYVSISRRAATVPRLSNDLTSMFFCVRKSIIPSTP